MPVPVAAIPRPVQLKLTLCAGVVIVAVCIAIRASSSGVHALLFLTGVALGVVLYRSIFGFTSAFRVLLAERRSAGFRAQMIMLGSACLLFFPALASGSLWGTQLVGFVSPVGVSVAVGAFLFGIGMQLGGGCASGTLYSLGGGSTRMLATLAFFVMGSVLGFTQLAWWSRLPSLGPISMIATFGWPLALGLNLAVFAGIYRLVLSLERSKYGGVVPIASTPGASWVRGPWPLLAGALGLAALNFVTLCLAGRPWGITSAYVLWGGKALQSIGIPVSSWSGYSDPPMRAALAQGVLADITSVMDFGIVLGALAAASVAGKFSPVWRITGHHFAASVIGGLLLGYGARLAYGCNIGSFFSGIASGSVHGWLWIAFALLGTRVGLLVRPVFKL